MSTEQAIPYNLGAEAMPDGALIALEADYVRDLTELDQYRFVAENSLRHRFVLERIRDEMVRRGLRDTAGLDDIVEPKQEFVLHRVASAREQYWRVAACEDDDAPRRRDRIEAAALRMAQAIDVLLAFHRAGVIEDGEAVS